LAGSVQGVVVQMTANPRGSRQCGQAERRRQPLELVGHERKSDVHGDVGLVGVLDLGLGQCRAAVETPVHRLEAPEHVALLQQAAQHPQFVGLIARRHRQVRVVPFAQHAHPDEVLLLAGNLFGRIGARARLHQFGRLVLAVLFFDLDLDRHAVAVPARHVARVKTRHLAALDHHVLQDLVDRMADVQVAVGVRRAVMQDPHRAAQRVLTDAVVGALVLP
jgi:hypothetical protein